MHDFYAEVLPSDLKACPELTPAYLSVLNELSNTSKYCVRSVYQHYVTHNGVPDDRRATVVLRIDVDNGFHLSLPLALHIHKRGLTASHYFLTHPERYYNLWNSTIPKKIYELGQEVGLHSDHYYEQLVYGVNGLENLRRDINRLSHLIGSPIKGMVYHGHNDMNALGKTNWELTNTITPSYIGLEYNDGLYSCYIKPDSKSWRPKCDYRLSDYMGLPQSWGWNYLPSYPVQKLKAHARPGFVIHIGMHTINAFKYWNYWTPAYQEKMPEKESIISFQHKRYILIIRLFTNFFIRKASVCLKSYRNFFKRSFNKQ